MNTERLIKIMLMELSNDGLKLEQDLEEAINSQIETKDKINLIKDVLAKIVTNEASIVKFNDLLNNNKQKPKQDE